MRNTMFKTKVRIDIPRLVADGCDVEAYCKAIDKAYLDEGLIKEGSDYSEGVMFVGVNGGDDFGRIFAAYGALRHEEWFRKYALEWTYYTNRFSEDPTVFTTEDLLNVKSCYGVAKRKVKASCSSEKANNTMFKTKVRIDIPRLVADGYDVESYCKAIVKVYSDRGLIKEGSDYGEGVMFVGVNGGDDFGRIGAAYGALRHKEWFRRYLLEWTYYTNRFSEDPSEFTTEDFMEAMKK